jgi:AraC-like DNA-binding protein
MHKHSPLLEDAFHRDSALGYDPPSDISCLVRCVSHGVPSPLIRWHYHEEYELHLVVATSGKFFVGDYIGDFEPGNLVLTGPRLPHNWISENVPPAGVPLRDHCIIFDRQPIKRASELMPELREVLPLLDHAAHGVEFFGISSLAIKYFERIAAAKHVVRLAAFFEFLGLLNRCRDYRLLSYGKGQAPEKEKATSRIDAIVNFISDNYTEPMKTTTLSRRFGMSESHFSRVFRHGTGRTFTDFVTRLRISRACQLLMQSDAQITTICYDVGFNNLANFNRRFMSVKGMTPSAFRQVFRQCVHSPGPVGGAGLVTGKYQFNSTEVRELRTSPT